MDTTKKGTIYLASSPSGKKFVGYCFGNVQAAWRQHEHDAGGKGLNKSAKLNAEIRNLKTTGGGSFAITILERDVPHDDVKTRRDHHVDHQQATLNREDRVYSGGMGATQKTRDNMSKSHKKRHAENNYAPMKKETKLQISKTLTKEVRLDHEGQELPKYVRYTQQKDRTGYMIWEHPKHPQRIYFVKKSLTLEQNKEACLSKLRELDRAPDVPDAPDAPVSPKRRRRLPTND